MRLSAGRLSAGRLSAGRLSAGRLSFILQHLISMPIYKLNLYLNIKNWFTSVFINASL